MTDAELVAAELARLDALADTGDDDTALYAFVRAYALRRLPVHAAAVTLRQEALKALAGELRWNSNRWPLASFHLRMAARWAGVPRSIVETIPRDDEVRMYVRRHPRVPGKILPPEVT